MNSINRRTFLAATAAGTAFAMRASLGQSANERLGIAIIGCGGRGNHHLNELIPRRDELNVQVVALCDVWKKNLNATADTIEKATGARPKTFARYRDVLALPEVDAVVITTPDFAHTPILIEASNAGKQVFCEKPVSINMEEAVKAVDTVEANKTIFQAGTQHRSEGTHIAAARMYQTGLLGTLIKAYCTFNDCRARWIRDYSDVLVADVDWEQYRMHLPAVPFDARKFRLWHLYKEHTTGLIGLLGVHPIDVTHMYTQDNFPESCVGLGTKGIWKEREHDDIQLCVFKYPTGHLLHFESRLGNMNGGPQNVLYGSHGTFDIDSWTFTGEGGGDGKIVEPVKVAPDVVPTHLENWIQCIRAKNPKTNADIHAAYAHSVASIMGYTACETGKKMVYDSASRSMREA